MELIKFQKARLEKNKLIIDDSITIDEWKDLGQLLKQVEGSVQFWIGDWARFGEKKGFTGKYVSPKVYDELEELTGLDRGTIQNLKSVAEKTSSFRNEDLSYTHHVAVAPLEPEQQKKFLQKASEEKLSTRELREEIRKEKEHGYRQEWRLNEKLAIEKELKALAKEINSKYNSEQRNFLITLINK